jgi:hypothetical protein
MRWVLVALASLIVALGGLIAWMGHSQEGFCPKPRLPPGIRSPILAIELPRSAHELTRVLRYPDWDRNREVVRDLIFEDWFFIASYWAFFAGLGLVTWRDRLPGAWLLAIAIWAFITLAAWYDIQENRAILDAMDSRWVDLADAKALAILHPSLAKWASLFATCLLVGPLFLCWRGRGFSTRWLARLAGAASLAAGVIGFYGLVSHPSIETALAALTIGMLFVFVLFVLPLASFLRGTRPHE